MKVEKKEEEFDFLTQEDKNKKERCDLLEYAEERENRKKARKIGNRRKILLQS